MDTVVFIDAGFLYTYFSKNRESSFSRSNELLKTVSRFVRLKKEDFEKSNNLEIRK